MIIITRREGEEVVVGDPANPIGIVRVVSIKADRVRMAFAFEEGLEVHRREMAEATLSNSDRVPVLIYLPDADQETDLVELELIRRTIDDFMESFGFEYDPELDPVITTGSWEWRAWFRRIKPGVSKELGSVYGEMREALRREFLDSTGAEAYAKRAEATSTLVTAFRDYDRAVARLGDVILVKAVVGGQSQIVVESITPALARVLEEKPGLLHQPEGLLGYLEGRNREVQAATEKTLPEGRGDQPEATS